MKGPLRFLLSVACLIVFFSCNKAESLKDLDLPVDTAMNDANRFALIIDTYVSIRDVPGDEGINIAHARKLDIFPVEGLEITKKDDEQILWVNLGNGWVQRSSVQLYSTKEKALTAAKRLK